jgi:hypothetical protein
VTGLGEFSPFGRSFTLGSFFVNYKSGQNFGAAFYRRKRYAIILAKNGLGCILGDFLSNALGHPSQQ